MDEVNENDHSCSAASVQGEIQREQEQLIHLLIESEAVLSKLETMVSEMQVTVVEREVRFANLYHPELIESTLEILDSEEPFHEIDEMNDKQGTEENQSVELVDQVYKENSK